MFGSHPDVLVLSKLTMPLQLQWQQFFFPWLLTRGIVYYTITLPDKVYAV